MDLDDGDMSHYTDADWAALNTLKAAWKDGGQKALSKAMEALAENDPVRYSSVMAAYFPTEIANAIRDRMAEIGMTEEDLRELVRKLESPARDQ
jgi:hypothetical protein